MIDPKTPEISRCARCGAPAEGYATIGDDRFCHGDNDQPTCYMQEMWTRSGASAYGPITTLRLGDERKP